MNPFDPNLQAYLYLLQLQAAAAQSSVHLIPAQQQLQLPQMTAPPTQLPQNLLATLQQQLQWNALWQQAQIASSQLPLIQPLVPASSSLANVQNQAQQVTLAALTSANIPDANLQADEAQQIEKLERLCKGEVTEEILSQQLETAMALKVATEERLKLVSKKMTISQYKKLKRDLEREKKKVLSEYNSTKKDLSQQQIDVKANNISRQHRLVFALESSMKYFNANIETVLNQRPSATDTKEYPVFIKELLVFINNSDGITEKTKSCIQQFADYNIDTAIISTLLHELSNGPYETKLHAHLTKIQEIRRLDTNHTNLYTQLMLIDNFVKLINDELRSRKGPTALMDIATRQLRSIVVDSPASTKTVEKRKREDTEPFVMKGSDIKRFLIEIEEERKLIRGLKGLPRGMISDQIRIVDQYEKAFKAAIQNPSNTISQSAFEIDPEQNYHIDLENIDKSLFKYQFNTDWLKKKNTEFKRSFPQKQNTVKVNPAWAQPSSAFFILPESSSASSLGAIGSGNFSRTNAIGTQSSISISAANTNSQSTSLLHPSSTSLLNSISDSQSSSSIIGSQSTSLLHPSSTSFLYPRSDSQASSAIISSSQGTSLLPPSSASYPRSDNQSSLSIIGSSQSISLLPPPPRLQPIFPSPSALMSRPIHRDRSMSLPSRQNPNTSFTISPTALSGSESSRSATEIQAIDANLQQQQNKLIEELRRHCKGDATEDQLNKAIELKNNIKMKLELVSEKITGAEYKRILTLLNNIHTRKSTNATKKANYLDFRVSIRNALQFFTPTLLKQMKQARPGNPIFNTQFPINNYFIKSFFDKHEQTVISDLEMPNFKSKMERITANKEQFATTLQVESITAELDQGDYNTRYMLHLRKIEEISNQPKKYIHLYIQYRISEMFITMIKIMLRDQTISSASASLSSEHPSSISQTTTASSVQSIGSVTSSLQSNNPIEISSSHNTTSSSSSQSQIPSSYDPMVASQSSMPQATDDEDEDELIRAIIEQDRQNSIQVGSLIQDDDNKDEWEDYSEAYE